MATESELEAALEEFASQERVIVALDFDGTLAPLVADPEQSRLTAAAARALPLLATHPRIELALVSGRPGTKLAQLAQPPTGTHLIGSHGAEIGVMGPNGFAAEELALTSQQQKLLDRVRQELAAIAAQYDGTWVEHKPASAALHTRPASQQIAEKATKVALSGPANIDGTVVLQGKSVVEIGVLAATKGDAITQLRNSLPISAVLFMGDDVTDEHAFAVLNDGHQGRPDSGDIGVKVGPGETAATYRVADPDAVATTLNRVAELFANIAN